MQTPPRKDITAGKPPVLFMGTPEFAARALAALDCAGYPIVGAVTQPDKPKGRGYELTPPPVKSYALSRGIPVFQPQTLKDGAFAGTLAELSPRLIVVAAYGKIVPGYILDFPELGCVNIHASLLPKYRGAAPIQRAIMAGERVTGITTMMMDAGIDTGGMLEREEVEIGGDDDFEAVHDRLAEVGARLIITTAEKLAAGTLKAVKQDDSLATYAAKIEKADCRLDFTRPARALRDQIRSLSPAPLAFTAVNGRALKVIAAEFSPEPARLPPGTVTDVGSGTLDVACGDGVLKITRLLPEGKKPMAAAAFINGRGAKTGDIFG